MSDCCEAGCPDCDHPCPTCTHFAKQRLGAHPGAIAATPREVIYPEDAPELARLLWSLGSPPERE